MIKLEKIFSVKKETVRSLIVKKRKHLKKRIAKEGFSKWFFGATQKDRYGEKLELTSEQTYEVYKRESQEHGYAIIGSDYINCQNCSRLFDLDEEFILMTFSFCDEYSCGMVICKKCLKEMIEL